MIDSQSQIMEKLRTLNSDETTKKFIVQIMEFYKGHMSKLQSIIVQKQTQIDDFFELKERYEDRITDLSNELDEVKTKVNEGNENTWQHSTQLEELNGLISSLKADLQNNEFDKQVLRDDIRNLNNKIDILESQLKMTMTHNAELKAELIGIKQAKPVQKPDFQTTQLLEEIKDIKQHLNTGSKSINEAPMKTSQIISARRNPFDIDASFDRSHTAHKEDRGSKSVNEYIPEKESKVETRDIDVEELQSYLTFLQDKEKGLQTKLWKMPQRDRSVNEKKERLAMEAQLSEVTNEILSIKQLLKQSK